MSMRDKSRFFKKSAKSTTRLDAEAARKEAYRKKGVPEGLIPERNKFMDQIEEIREKQRKKKKMLESLDPMKGMDV